MRERQELEATKSWEYTCCLSACKHKSKKKKRRMSEFKWSQTLSVRTNHISNRRCSVSLTFFRLGKSRKDRIIKNSSPHFGRRRRKSGWSIIVVKMHVSAGREYVSRCVRVCVHWAAPGFMLVFNEFCGGNSKVSGIKLRSCFLYLSQY